VIVSFTAIAYLTAHSHQDNRIRRVLVLLLVSSSPPHKTSQRLV
jgi:hypothetical protein